MSFSPKDVNIRGHLGLGEELPQKYLSMIWEMSSFSPEMGDSSSSSSSSSKAFFVEGNT